MISNLSQRLVSYLINQNTIDEAERELYVYGFFILFSCLYYFCFALTIGLICGIGWESFLFFISYFGIRQFAGGHHAKTEGRCLFFSSVSILLCIVLIRFSVQNSFLRLPYGIVYVVSGAIILAFAPLDTPEKRLSKKEKQRYRKISYAVLAVLTAAFIGGMLGNAVALYSPIGAAVCFESVLMLYGKIAQAHAKRASADKETQTL